MKRLSKKLLSVLLAMALIVSCVTVCFTAFAETDNTNVYQVSTSSPVLPMLLRTKTNVNSLAVQLVSGGEYVAGGDLTWTITKNECELYIDAESGDIMAYGTGYANITVSDGTTSTEIVVSAAENADGKFNIFEYDFANWNNDVAAGTSPWALVDYRADNFANLDIATKVSYTAGKGALLTTSGGAQILYVKDAGPLKNFSDYTVAFTATNDRDYNSWSRTGAAGRITVDGQTGLATSASNLLVGAIGFTSETVSKVNFTIKNAAYLYSHGNYLLRSFNHNTDAAIIKSVAYDYEFNFNGSDVVFYAAQNGEELKKVYSLADDTDYASQTQVKTNLYKGAGTVGVASFDTKTYVEKFSVSVDVESLPELVEIGEIYAISKTSPALPIVVNTKVNTGAVKVQLTANGAYVNGADLDWSVVTETEGLVYKSESKDIYAYETGVYVMQVTDGVNTTQVAVIVDETADSEFNVFEYDFANMADEAANAEGKWIVQNLVANNITEYSTGSSGTLNLTYNSTYQGVTLSAGGKYYVLYYGDNTVLKLFSDYTVNYTAGISNIDTAGWRRIAAAGRIALNNSGLIDATTPYITAGIGTPNKINFMKTNASFLNASQFFQTMQTEEAFAIEAKTMYDFSCQFAGKNIIISAAKTGEELTQLYDLSEETTATTVTAVKNNLPTNTGTVGIYCTDTTAYIRCISVSANITSIPNSSPIVVEEEEPAPEATIIIVSGEATGTAAVEAVVGSENNYTVKLAPAEGYKVKVGSLFIDDEQIILGAEGDTTGRLYTFKSDDLNSTVITVEYIPDNGTFNSMMLGAQINEGKRGIRFGARTDLIKRTGEIGLLGDKLLVDGAVYKPTEVGMLFLPSALIDGELTVDSVGATRWKVSKVVNLTADFSDIAITLVGIPESYFATKISSRMYVAYEVGGETKYVYTEAIERSYNDVLAAIGK